MGSTTDAAEPPPWPSATNPQRSAHDDQAPTEQRAYLFGIQATLRPAQPTRTTCRHGEARPRLILCLADRLTTTSRVAELAVPRIRLGPDPTTEEALWCAHHSRRGCDADGGNQRTGRRTWRCLAPLGAAHSLSRHGHGRRVRVHHTGAVSERA